MLGLALLAVEYLRLTGGVEKLANTTSSKREKLYVVNTTLKKTVQLHNWNQILKFLGEIVVLHNSLGWKKPEVRGQWSVCLWDTWSSRHTQDRCSLPTPRSHLSLLPGTPSHA